jgi:hypothetical protein
LLRAASLKFGLDFPGSSGLSRAGSQMQNLSKAMTIGTFCGLESNFECELAVVTGAGCEENLEH